MHIEDAWINFGFAIINLISSVILAKIFGVFGVILGSIIGSLCTADWYRPVVIYKKVFDVSVKKYFEKYILYIFLGAIYMAITMFLNTFILIENNILNFIVRGLICVIVPNLCNILLFYKTKEFKYVYEILMNQLKRYKKDGKCTYLEENLF